jgi:SAM-dependent methyltransferase
VGFGDGLFLQWAAAAGWEAVGLDTDPVAVDLARRRGLQVRAGRVEDLTDERESFDVVTCSHVIEHVHDPRQLLASIYGLLRPGGLLWLDTPNIGSLGHRRFGRHWLGLDPPRHLVVFSAGALLALLESTGFVVLRRLSRFEVCKRFFAASARTAAGVENPARERPVPLAVRAAAYWASWRVRFDPRLSECITVLAVKPAESSRV